MLPFKIVCKPENRSQKAKVMPEFALCIKLLEVECECMFWIDLGTRPFLTYEEIYNEYLEKYQQAIYKLRSIHKLRFFAVSDSYFADVYRPVEKV